MTESNPCVNLPVIMVNKESETSTRSKIIEILRNNRAGVSGEVMASSLGISRVAVWKGIQSLNENGYLIKPTEKGYHLERDLSDSLFPWEFGTEEGRFRYWATTDSTMNRAREAALAHTESGLVITAECQSDGRGTGKKKWESESGGLFFTLITRPELNAAYSYRQVLAAQNAIVRTLFTVTGVQANTLWPNDIEIPASKTHDGGKIGGILCETLITGNTISFLNLGIGINTGIRPKTHRATSIPCGRKEILRQFLKEFEKTDASEANTISEWNSFCPLINSKISFQHTPDGELSSGIFRGITSAGWAIIDSGNSVPGETCYPPGTIHILHKERKT